VAEGYATVHAAGALGTEIRFFQMFVKFSPVHDSKEGFSVGGDFSSIFFKASGLAHDASLS
jgi:hypothetical protein